MTKAPQNNAANGIISADEGLNVINNTLQRLLSGKLSSQKGREALQTYTPQTVGFDTPPKNVDERNRRTGVLQSFTIGHQMADKAAQIRRKTELLDGQIKTVKGLKSNPSNTTTIANLRIVRTGYRDMLDNLAGLNEERLISDSGQLKAVEDGFLEFRASFRSFVKKTSDHSPSYKFDNEADGLSATSALTSNTTKDGSAPLIAFGSMSFENISRTEQMYIWQQLELRGHINDSVGLIRRITVAGTESALAMAGMLEGDEAKAKTKRDFLDRFLAEHEEWLAGIWQVNKDLTELEDAVAKAKDLLNDELDHMLRNHPDAEDDINNLRNSRDEMNMLQEMLEGIRMQFQNLTPDVDWRRLASDVKDASGRVARGLGRASEAVGDLTIRGLSKLGRAGADLYIEAEAALNRLLSRIIPSSP